MQITHKPMTTVSYNQTRVAKIVNFTAVVRNAKEITEVQLGISVTRGHLCRIDETSACHNLRTRTDLHRAN